MKKIQKILLAVSVLLSGLVIIGCGAADALKSTYNKWYKYNGTYSVPLGTNADEASGEAANYLENAEFYVYFDEGEGMTLAIQSTNETDVSLVHGLATTQVAVTTGGTKKFESVGKVRWGVLMYSGNFVRDEEPLIVSDPDSCIILAGENANEFKIQWKKVLANLILNKMLGE